MIIGLESEEKIWERGVRERKRGGRYKRHKKREMAGLFCKIDEAEIVVSILFVYSACYLIGFNSEQTALTSFSLPG